MHPEAYCRTLGALDPVKAVRAIHQAFLQLEAHRAGRLDDLDDGPSLRALSDCLRDAGHIGFTEGA